VTIATSYTPPAWAEQVLMDVNAEDPNGPNVPIDANTVGDITHWMPAEEPVGNWYDRDNPLNASLGTSSTDGTGSYPSLTAGAEYTAAMIDQSNMAGIRAALAADDPVALFSPAVVASPWASSHYGGDPQHIAETSPGGGAAPATAGAPGSALPAVDLSATATDTSFNANPFDLFGIPQTIGGAAASSVWSDVGPFIVKAMLVTAGLGVMVLGLSKMTGAGEKIKTAAPELATAAAA